MTIEHITHLDVPPGLPRAPAGDGERHRRAMPLTRLLGNGMEHGDAVRLHALAEAGFAWDAVGEWLGERNLARGAAALAAGHRLSARAWFGHATACFRFAQSAFATDTPRKRALYARLVDAFAQAVALDSPPGEHLTLPYDGAHLCAWLLRPATDAPPPVVVVIGGADGWREEYAEGARHLVARGIAVLLAELPGQGETRLMQGLHLRPDVERPVGAMIDALQADARLAPRIGLWGNSMGGSFVARAAARDARVAACCVNGGSATPIEVIERFPRIVEKLQAMTGSATPAEAVAVIAAIDIAGPANRIACPLLVTHGAPDRLFLLENAARLHDEAPAEDKQLLVWDDGEHCIYNHAVEKHTRIADWFAERLLPPRGR